MPFSFRSLRPSPHRVLGVLFPTLVALWVGPSSCSDAWAAKRGAVKRGVDEENCLKCHKYPKLGLYTKEGRRVFYVGEDVYAHSVHAKVPCRGCHTDIIQIPHRPDHKLVDCATACHVKDPFSNREFSHDRIRESLFKSTHGPKADEPPEKRKHKPNCKYCHLNPLYQYGEDYETRASLKRCRDCHAPEGVERAFEHVQYRMERRTSRDSGEIVALCSSCHADNSLMRVFEKTAAPAEGYKEYFHGKAVLRGWGKPANCVDCHTAHDVYPKDDTRSTVYRSHLLTTCSENPACHPKANPNFVQAAMHVTLSSEPNQALVWVNRGFTLLTVGTMSFLILHVFLDLNRRTLDAILERRTRRKKRKDRNHANGS